MTPDQEATVRPLLGQVSDREVERRTGIERRQVAGLRRRLGIPAWTAPVPEHGTTARARRRCPCEACRQAKAQQAAEEYARSGRTTTRGPMPAGVAERLHAARRESLARTSAVATRRGRWTDDELRVALDMSLSAAQAALALGRSQSAVEHQRARRASERTVSGPLPRGRRLSR